MLDQRMQAPRDTSFDSAQQEKSSGDFFKSRVSSR